MYSAFSTIAIHFIGLHVLNATFARSGYKWVQWRYDPIGCVYWCQPNCLKLDVRDGRKKEEAEFERVSGQNVESNLSDDWPNPLALAVEFHQIVRRTVCFVEPSVRIETCLWFTIPKEEPVQVRRVDSTICKFDGRNFNFNLGEAAEVRFPFSTAESRRVTETVSTFPSLESPNRMREKLGHKAKGKCRRRGTRQWCRVSESHCLLEFIKETARILQHAIRPACP